MEIHRKEGGPTFAWIERKTPIRRPALISKQSSLCGFHPSGDRGGGGPNGQIVSVKRAADGERQRGQKIIDEMREVHGQERILADSKGTTFVILINHASAPIKKESPTSKARREASRNEFMVKSGMLNRVESL